MVARSLFRLMSEPSRPLRLLTSTRFFRYWLGYSAPVFVFLALLAAWRIGPIAIASVASFLVVFWIETSTGYCRRCTHFNCGPHGWLMRRLFRRTSAPLPRPRLVLHVCLDLILGIGGIVLISVEWPWLLVPVVIWVAGAAVSVTPVSPAARRDTAKWGGFR